jgi:hypothetical protein
VSRALVESSRVESWTMTSDFCFFSARPLQDDEKIINVSLVHWEQPCDLSSQWHVSPAVQPFVKCSELTWAVPIMKISELSSTRR